MREPLGVVLVIAPWNYPFSLRHQSASPARSPRATASCSSRPRWRRPPARCSRACCPKYLDAEAVAVIEGGVPETTELLAQRFDHIFYTGNGTVGRIVMQAAAKHLTPVTLELGGKSPCIIDASVDLEVAHAASPGPSSTTAARPASRPTTCSCTRPCTMPSWPSCKRPSKEFYGDDPQRSKDYGRIVNDAPSPRA